MDWGTQNASSCLFKTEHVDLTQCPYELDIRRQFDVLRHREPAMENAA
jgi:hypothetical protein